MEQIDICPHCDQTMELTGETQSYTRGKRFFRSWICPSCGCRRETRQLGSEVEEVLMTSPPRAEVDRQAQEQVDRRAEGVKEFIARSQGGRSVY